MAKSWILGLGVVIVALGVAYGIRNQISGFDDPILSSKKPVIWWVVDDSQLNSRQWLDWGARTTHEPNEPYLKICYKRAGKMAGDYYDLQPVIGRVAAHQRLEAAGCVVPPDADRAPPFLWLAWCRAAFLSHLGGLWVDGSVLPTGKASLSTILAGKDVLTFGIDPDEGLAADEAQPMAGPSAGWSAVPHHPVWKGLERDTRTLINAGDQSWSSADSRKSLRYAWDRHAAGSVDIDRTAEVSRDRYGKRLELETLLTESEWSGTTKGSLWLPLPDGRDKLERATPFLWFLRMSEQQILESKFFWAMIAKKNVS
jgi:hypothetical protein